MLTSLRLVNFKAFADQTIPLRPLTLLSGLNGMGKSSVIQALLLLRQNFETRLLLNGKVSLNGSLVHLGLGRDVLFENASDNLASIVLDFDERIVFEPGDSAMEFAFECVPDLDVLSLQNYDDNYADSMLELARLRNMSMIVSGLFSTNFQYLQAERLGPRTSLPMSAYNVVDQHQLGTQGEYTAHFLAVFGEEKILKPSLFHVGWTLSQEPTLHELVELWMGEISPGTRINITMMPDIDAARFSYSFTRSESVTRDFRPTNVGFGISYTLPVLVALLSADPGALVLLENPEAHLHPHGQVKMGELIARAADAGIQVIVETHSDHVINGIRIAVKKGLVEPDAVALHFFQRPLDDDGTKGVEIRTPQLDEFGKLDFRPEGFFDQFDRSLDDLL